MGNLIIIGSGCAGLTAAIYAARANLNPLVVEGREPGGQLTATTLVENFPGFPDGIQGPDLIINMHRQAEKFGARFQYGVVKDFIPGVKGEPHNLLIDDKWVQSMAIIIASGASARWLGLPNEAKLKGHGLTACATCDGAFYRNVPVCVVGGGDTACEEALFLSRFASKVYLIHRRNSLRASVLMAQKALNNAKIIPVWDSVVTEYIPDSKGEISAVVLKDVKTGQVSNLEVKCVFVAIGHTPNTKPFEGKIPLDGEGYIILTDGVKTAVRGIFAAGDVADVNYKQAITAAGQGCAAALEAQRFLAESDDSFKHHGPQ
jgi:thioredoxin reductase (NADPH)